MSIAIIITMVSIKSSCKSSQVNAFFQFNSYLRSNNQIKSIKESMSINKIVVKSLYDIFYQKFARVCEIHIS